ncbi:MAG: hypothetical protein FWG13_06305 [Leptospirales bacterium]|nr:hypothetical protein [Leptospirales bacterium]
MDVEKKNLIYKALALTFCIMFLSLLFSQILGEKKMSKFDLEMTYLRDTLKESQVILSLRSVLNTSGDSNNILTDGLANRLFKTGIDIERLSNNEDSNTFFRKVSREWIYLNIELWQKLISHNRSTVNKKDYIIYIYPAECNECVSYRNLFNKLHREYGEDLWMFILPDDPESSALHTIKQYYKIKNNIPAVILNGKTTEISQIESALKESVDKKNKKQGKAPKK